MKLNLPLLTRAHAQPWAMHQPWLHSLAQMIVSGAPIERREAESKPAARPQAGMIPLNFESYFAAKRLALPDPGNANVFMVWGPVGRGWTMEDRYWLDAIEVDDIINGLAAAPDGSTNVLWLRSPGGIITGIPETAAAIRAATKTKTVIAFTDDLCASAAYWLASQCSQIIATPTAAIGSIGVYIALYDYSGALDKMGMKLDLFKAGEMKALGLPGTSLNDAQRNHLQASVDEGYRQFTRDVTNMRAISKDTMQGQTLDGKNAKDANLADAFIPSASAFFTALAKGKYATQ